MYWISYITNLNDVHLFICLLLFVLLFWRREGEGKGKGKKGGGGEGDVFR